MTSKKAMVWSLGAKVLATRVSSKLGRRRAMASTSGQMAQSTEGLGKATALMAVVFMWVVTAAGSRVDGKTLSSMVWGGMHGKMDDNMLGSILRTKRMVLEFSHGPMAESTRDFGDKA